MPRRTHSKPYSCAYCPRRFRDAHARHLHIKAAHRPPTVEAKPWDVTPRKDPR